MGNSQIQIILFFVYNLQFSNLLSRNLLIEMEMLYGYRDGSRNGSRNGTYHATST